MHLSFTDAQLRAATQQGDDRRGGVRLPLMVSAIVRRETLPESVLPVRLYDSSAGGLSFTSPAAIRAEEFIEISYALADGRHSHRMQVTHCESIGPDTYRIGVRSLDG